MYVVLIILLVCFHFCYNIVYIFVGLLNLRGSDIDFNPVFFAYVIVTLDSVHLFVDSTKLPVNYADHFATNNVTVTIHSYTNVGKVLEDLV